MDRYPQETDDARRLEALRHIVVALMQTHHREEILPKIVREAMDLFKADGGTLFLKSGNALECTIGINDTLKAEFKKQTISLKQDGIAVYVFNTAQALCIEDVYSLDTKLPYKFNEKSDRANGYCTRSLLAIPLVSTQKETLGVLQIINKKLSINSSWPIHDKEKQVLMPDFDSKDLQLLESFASIASAALENTLLYESIEQLLEGFIQASIRAIESRDPITSGHSERVAKLSVKLAESVWGGGLAPFSPKEIQKIRYAALLHDFGKIGVPEAILQKSHKLYKHEISQVVSRLGYSQMRFENRWLMRLLVELKDTEQPPTQNHIESFQKLREGFRKQLSDCWKLVEQLNQPFISAKDVNHLVVELEKMDRGIAEKCGIRPIRPKYLSRLKIQKGSLTPEERIAIESHVSATYKFLKDIPWGKQFADLPEITYAHHEKLDGSGYPRGLHANEIPLQSRVLTIADIYDALVSADRPYKNALTNEKAIAILREEAKEGKLDTRLLDIFIESKSYEVITPRHGTDEKKKAA